MRELIYEVRHDSEDIHREHIVADFKVSECHVGAHTKDTLKIVSNESVNDLHVGRIARVLYKIAAEPFCRIVEADCRPYEAGGDHPVGKSAFEARVTDGLAGEFDDFGYINHSGDFSALGIKYACADMAGKTKCSRERMEG